MVIQDINQVKVGVYDKVREYYREDKYLGGLIKVFKIDYIANLGREVSIIIPVLDSDDRVTINGIDYSPSTPEYKVRSKR